MEDVNPLHATRYTLPACFLPRGVEFHVELHRGVHLPGTRGRDRRSRRIFPGSRIELEVKDPARTRRELRSVVIVSAIDLTLLVDPERDADEFLRGHHEVHVALPTRHRKLLVADDQDGRLLLVLLDDLDSGVSSVRSDDISSNGGTPREILIPARTHDVQL